MTHESVFELNETGQADGIVTYVYLNLAMRGGAKSSEEVVWHEVRNRMRRALEKEDNRLLKWDASRQRFVLKPEIKKIFVEGSEHDEHLALFERTMRVRAVRQDMLAYTTQCKLQV
jgi:hypothetical protein